MRIIVVGGGVSGLGSALMLSRTGHQVTVIERDDTPLPKTADEAFEWDRRGAPQVRHSHAFLARLRNLLRDHYPDVLQALLDAGATEMRFGDNMAPTIANYAPESGDEDLGLLACRRTTFEWVLRTIVTREGNVTIHTGTGVNGLIASANQMPPRITGVTLEGGQTSEADVVIVANGRRSALPEWLEAIGVATPTEEIEDTGIVYYSRFYRLNNGQEFPTAIGGIGGDLGYLKYGVFVGDNRTFSVTLATSTNDAELRRRLTDESVFTTIASALPATMAWVESSRATPITDVHTMAGLLNRLRTYVENGTPIAVGVLPIGDARLCTNPLYGRGCSTGFWTAHLATQAINQHPDHLDAMATAYHAAVVTEVEPHYRSSVAQDSEARRVATALLDGENPDGDPDDPRAFMRSVLREGLLPALRFDAVVLRAFFRTLNLLDDPNTLVTDPEIQGRVLNIWNARHDRGPEPTLGPPRAELLTLIGRPT